MAGKYEMKNVGVQVVVSLHILLRVFKKDILKKFLCGGFPKLRFFFLVISNSNPFSHTVCFHKRTAVPKRVLRICSYFGSCLTYKDEPSKGWPAAPLNVNCFLWPAACINSILYFVYNRYVLCKL